MFCDNNVTILDWPAKSPDANPIENLWSHLKITANQFHPETQGRAEGAGGNFPSNGECSRRIEAIYKARGKATNIECCGSVDRLIGFLKATK
jgi:hypothetical protein